MEASHKRELRFDVIASFPGSYGSEVSFAYLYYSDEYKYYCESLSIEINLIN